MWNNLKEKLWSRKFIMALVTAVLVLLNEGFDMGIPEDTVMQFVTVILGWIFAETAVDVSRNVKGGNNNGKV